MSHYSHKAECCIKECSLYTKNDYNLLFTAHPSTKLIKTSTVQMIKEQIISHNPT